MPIAPTLNVRFGSISDGRLTAKSRLPPSLEIPDLLDGQLELPGPLDRKDCD